MAKDFVTTLDFTHHRHTAYLVVTNIDVEIIK